MATPTTDTQIPAPTVGLIAHMTCGSDRYTVEITRVSGTGRKVWFRTVSTRRDGSKRYGRREGRAIDRGELTHWGARMLRIVGEDDHIILDGPCDYHDPSF